MILMTLIVLRSTDHIFCKMLLCWGLSNYFLVLIFSYSVFGEEDHRSKVPFSSHISDM